MKANTSKIWLVLAMLLLALNLACETGAPTATSPPNTEVSKESPAYVRLLERYSFSPRSQPPELYPNELPEDIPINIPVPEGDQLLGTTVRNFTRDRKDIQVFIESSLTPKEVVTFYTDWFAGEGWEEPTDANRMVMIFNHGFVAAGIPISKVFCPPRSQVGVGLQPVTLVAGYSRDYSTTDIQIGFMYTSRDSGCEQIDPYTDFLFPRLEAPLGANASFGSGGGSDYESTRTRIETTLSLTEIEKHYRDQLLAEGWELLKVGDDAHTAWSTWLVTEEGSFGIRRWMGMLEIRYAISLTNDNEADGERGETVTLSASLQVMTSNEEP